MKSDPWGLADLHDLGEAAFVGDVGYAFVALDGEPTETDIAWLSDDERARASRFVCPTDARRFVVAHAALRLLLASYAGCAREDVRYETSANGKPRLDLDLSPGLEFNLSHSSEIGLIAVTRGTALGVDVEHVRPIPDLLDIADRYFSPTEAKVLRAAPLHDREAAFYRCWTRKEAVVKAMGDGLSRPLDSFTVDLEPGSASALRTLDGVPGDRSRWSLRDLSAPAGYVAAGAVARAGSLAATWTEVILGTGTRMGAHRLPRLP